MQVNERVICLRTHEEKLFSDGKIMETHWGREKGFVRKAQLDKYDSCTRSRAHPLQTKKKITGSQMVPNWTSKSQTNNSAWAVSILKNNREWFPKGNSCHHRWGGQVTSWGCFSLDIDCRSCTGSLASVPTFQAYEHSDRCPAIQPTARIRT